MLGPHLLVLLITQIHTQAFSPRLKVLAHDSSASLSLGARQVKSNRSLSIRTGLYLCSPSQRLQIFCVSAFTTSLPSFTFWGFLLECIIRASSSFELRFIFVLAAWAQRFISLFTIYHMGFQSFSTAKKLTFLHICF